MRVSVIVPYSPPTGAAILDYADLVRCGLADRLWLGQTAYAEPHQLFSYLAGAGCQVPTGTSVTLSPLRHPWEAALQARSVALLSGRPHVAGFGQGSTTFVRAMRGSSYPSPLAAMEEYLVLVRRCLDGEPVFHDGEYYHLEGAVPPIETPRVDVGVGVLREKMALLAGRRADAAITWMTPPRFLENVVIPALEKGSAQQTRPNRPHLAAVVHFGVARPGRKPWKRVMAAMALHLQQPHYQAMLRTAGIAVDDLESALRDLVASSTYLWGDVDEVADRLRTWDAAGVDEVILNALGTHSVDGPEQALGDLRDVLTHIAR